MATHPEAIVAAFAAGRSSDMLRMIAAASEADEHPRRRAYAVLASFQAQVGGASDWQSTQALLDRALSTPPEEPDLLVCLLAVACHGALLRQALDEESRLQTRLDDCWPVLTSPQARMVVTRRRYTRSALIDGDFVRAQVALRQCMAAVVGEPELHREVEQTLIRVRLCNHDLKGMAATVARSERDGVNTLELVWNRRLLALFTGQASSILDDFAQNPDEGDHRLSPGLYDVVAQAAVVTGDHEACQRLNSWLVGILDRGGSQNRPELRRNWQACVMLSSIYSAFIRRDYGLTRELLRVAGRLSRPLTSFARDLMRLSIQVELSQRASAQARVLLRTLDPERNRAHLLMEWTRLHLQEGHLEEARRCYAQMLSRGGIGLVEYGLAWAHELDAKAMLQLGQAPSSNGAAVVQPLPAASAPASTRYELIGDSLGIQAVRDQILRIAVLAQPVLISGETGTGKEVAARLLHALGPAAKAPFIALNCAAIPDALAEAELFGHRKGAFTGAERNRDGLITAAEAGIIFLDEINSMSLRLQSLLLRVLETGEFRQIGGTATLRCQARWIMASNSDLQQDCDLGHFRRDLYYRISGFTIHLPPLRERIDDLPALCRHFLEQCSGRADLQIEPQLMRAFARHRWSGNVRELRNVIERMALLRGDQTVFTVADCPELALHPAATGVGSELSESVFALSGSDTAVKKDLSSQPPVCIPGAHRARERRARLLALFADCPHLYREDVVRRLGCPPSTASEDLLILEQAGLIRRVASGASRRKGFYVKVP